MNKTTNAFNVSDNYDVCTSVNIQYICVFFGVTATVVVGVAVVAVVAILAFAILYAYKLRIR